MGMQGTNKHGDPIFVPSWKEIWIVHHFQGNDLKWKPIPLSNLKVDYILLTTWTLRDLLCIKDYNIQSITELVKSLT